MVEPRPMITQLMPSGRPLARNTSLTMFWQAMAHSGVLLDGFQTTVSPQTQASAEFQAQTATGKLKALMTPTTPRGCHCSIMRCCGPFALQGRAAEGAAQTHGEVADVDHLLHLAQALGQDLAHLQADQRAEHLLLRAQRLAHLAHDLAAPGRRQHAPDQERVAGVLHDPLVVGGAGLLDARQHLAGGRIDRGEEVAAVGEPLAAAVGALQARRQPEGAKDLVLGQRRFPA